MLVEMFKDLIAAENNWTRLLSGGLLVGYRFGPQGRVLQIGRVRPDVASAIEVDVVLRDFGAAAAKLGKAAQFRREDSTSGLRTFRGQLYNVAFYPFDMLIQGVLDV